MAHLNQSNSHPSVRRSRGIAIVRAKKAAERQASQLDVQVTRTMLHLHHPLQQQRHQLIAEAAYRRAEARGFTPGDELNDWLAAEAEVDARIQTERAA